MLEAVALIKARSSASPGPRLLCRFSVCAEWRSCWSQPYRSGAKTNKQRSIVCRLHSLLISLPISSIRSSIEAASADLADQLPTWPHLEDLLCAPSTWRGVITGAHQLFGQKGNTFDRAAWRFRGANDQLTSKAGPVVRSRIATKSQSASPVSPETCGKQQGYSHPNCSPCTQISVPNSTNKARL